MPHNSVTILILVIVREIQHQLNYSSLKEIQRSTFVNSNEYTVMTLP